MDFSTFKNKYILTGKIVVLNALHIGSGREKDDRDAPFISLDDDKNFYIPGSTFRGYLSTKLERFLDSGNGFKIKNNGEELNEADVKLIFGYTNLDKLETKINDKDNEEDRKLKENNRKIQDRIIRKLNAKNLDEVKSLAGRIHVSDMPVLKDVKYVTRDGIKIDRNTGATKDGAKFDYNIIPLGSKFKFEMEIENVEEYQLDLIKLALKDILDEDLFGGKLSRGIGKCKLNIEKIEFADRNNIQDYLFKKSMKTKDIKEIFEIKNLILK